MDGEPEAYKDDSLRSAGITAKERLARIEDILVRMDDKLDGKAEKAEVVALAWRVQVLEKDAALLVQETKASLLVANEVTRELHLDHKDLALEVAGLKTRMAWFAGATASLLFIGDIVLKIWKG